MLNAGGGSWFFESIIHMEWLSRIITYLVGDVQPKPSFTTGILGGLVDPIHIHVTVTNEGL